MCIRDRYYALNGPPKGEVSVVIGPTQKSDRISEKELDQMLNLALQDSSVKDASTLLAKTTGLTRREIYARALALKPVLKK